MSNRYFQVVASIILLTNIACGPDAGPPPPPPEAKCGTLKTNETCISLANPDTFSDERHFILNTPENLTDNPPLYISLHGGGGRAGRVADLYQFQTMIFNAGFIGVFPDAIIRNDGVSIWNAHDSTYGISHIDDVSFIRNIIESLVDSHNIDPARVFVFGWSNGGFMANRLACEIPDKITAIYTLAGNLRDELTNCSDEGDVAVQHLHSTGDQIVPFAGDSNQGYISAQEAIRRWVDFNQCDEVPNTIGPFDLTRDEPSDDSNSYRYVNCRANVEFTVIDGSDHGPNFQLEMFHQLLVDFFERSAN